MPRGVLLLVVLLALTSCRSGGDGHRRPAPLLATAAASVAPTGSATPTSAAPAAPSCELANLRIVRSAPRGSIGASVAGAWWVPFAVVDTGSACTLGRRVWFAHAGLDMAQLDHDVLLRAHGYLVVHLVLAGRRGPCRVRRGPTTPLLIGQRDGASASAVAVRGVGVPTSGLSCRLRLVPDERSRPAPVALLDRPDPRPSLSPAALGDGSHEAPGHTADVVGLASGATLPLFCAPSTRKYETGLLERATIQSDVGGRATSEDRQVDRYRSGRAAETAYEVLRGQAAACTYDPPDTKRLLPAGLGTDSFAIDYVSPGTGAGYTYQRWAVARVGWSVLVGVTTRFFSPPPFPHLAAVVRRLRRSS